MQLFKLRFQSALHVDSKGSGNPEVSDDFIRSDTLSAALCLSWAAIHRDAGPGFFKEPPFTVSSAFPYIGDTLLFPMPAWRIWRDISDDAKRKSLKKIRWVSRGIFNRLLSGKQVDPEETHVLPGGAALFREETGDSPEFKNAPSWAVSERQRVLVDRLGLATDGGLFFFALQFFAPWAGLWFLANGSQETLEKLRGALAFLGDTGIGADRNSGLGHFQVVTDTAYDLPKAQGGGFVSLSLFNPGETDAMERLTRKTAYGITTRAGWIVQSTIGRPPIRVFTEGSYFSERPRGRVVEMLPEAVRIKYGLSLNHAAPRDFRALFMPCAEPPGLKE